MKSDKIFDYILNTEEDNVSLIARTAWENIKQELLEKEKMIVLKEILGGKIIYNHDKYFVIKHEPFNLLFYNDNHIEPVYNGIAFKILLSENNFKLLLKQEIIDCILYKFETARDNISFYQSIVQDVINAF